MDAVSRRALDAMMFAMEPVIVKLPAKVEDIASASQPACGSGKLTTRVRKRSTSA